MVPSHDLDRQDELLIAVSLFDYSREWATAEPANAERAWFLCRVICESHALMPSEAVLELVGADGSTMLYKLRLISRHRVSAVFKMESFD